MSADALAEAYVYCGQIARENERDLWLAALFAPERLRPHLQALAAFAHETGVAAARVREPVAGEMRLAWWREALAGARTAEAAGAPIAAALIDTMTKFALPVSALEDLLQALTFDVYDDAMESLEALEAYGIATAGALTALRAQVLAEGRQPGAQGASDAAGAGLALARAVLDFAAGRRRPLLVPRALLERCGVSLADARVGGGGGGVRAALAELADAADARIDEAEARLAALPAALAPAFAPLATARLDLRRWRRARAAPFAPAAPWRRQWALWRWARRR
ncbi:MAG: squalene/phytoene synthase family protein [Roseiarcus sp.]|jgi:phytoene synthase|uniref:squalene/phytoene synthase family protein n=1 Tax=Roseiarcus sp. TaxID=1969460 RepID=UPI003C22E1F8